MHRELTTQILALTKGTMLESNLAAHVDLSILVLRVAGNCSSNSDITKCYPPGYVSTNIITAASISITLTLDRLPLHVLELWCKHSQHWCTWEEQHLVDNFPQGGETSDYVMWDVGWHVDGDSNAAHHWRCQPVYSTQLGMNATQIKVHIHDAVTPTSSVNDKVVTGGQLNVGTF